jgi:hypothetical protein
MVCSIGRFPIGHKIWGEQAICPIIGPFAFPVHPVILARRIVYKRGNQPAIHGFAGNVKI